MSPNYLLTKAFKPIVTRITNDVLYQLSYWGNVCAFISAMWPLQDVLVRAARDCRQIYHFVVGLNDDGFWWRVYQQWQQL